MSGRVFLGFLYIGNTVRVLYGLNLWGRFNCRSYSTAQKIETAANEKISKAYERFCSSQYSQYKH